MNDENIKSYLQQRLADYRHPVDEALWPSLEHTAVPKKKSRRLILITAGCAAVLAVLFFLLRLPEGDAAPDPADPVIITDQLRDRVIPPQETNGPSISPEISGNGVYPEKVEAAAPVEEPEVSLHIPDNDTPHEAISRPDSLPVKKTTEKNGPSPSVRPEPRNPVFYTGRDRKARGQFGLQVAYRGGFSPEPSQRSGPVFTSPGNIFQGADGKPVDVTDPVYHFPVSFSITVNKSLTRNVSLETGLSYTYLRTTVRYGDTDIRLHYLGIPVKATYTFYKNNRFSLYGGAGGMAERQIAGKVINESGDKRLVYNGLQWSVSGTAGIGYHLGKHTGIFIEPGVSYYFDDRSRIPSIRKEKPLNIHLQVGFRVQFE